MDIVSFVFGILVMCSLLIVIGFVIGIIKMVRHGKKLVEIERTIEDIHNQISINHSELSDNLDKKVDEIYRECGDIRSYVDSRIDKALQHPVNKA